MQHQCPFCLLKQYMDFDTDSDNDMIYPCLCPLQVHRQCMKCYILIKEQF